MSPVLEGVVRRFRTRVEDHGARRGLVYPWWVPVLSAMGQLCGGLYALIQRDALWPLRPVALTVVIVAATCLLHFVGGRLDRWWLTLVPISVAVVWLLQVPLTADRTIDIAPAIFTLAVAELVVDHGARVGLLSTVVALVTVVLAGVVDPVVGPFYVGEILFGLVLGVMFRWQMRALAAEHGAREEESERATLAERQRVAREIHDLVAHSMSVTMLHVTGARRALTEDADVADAVDALVEAERIGRQAMADIRRTVSVLRTGTSDTRPLPGAADLPALVDDVRAAGLVVEWRQTGDLTGLDAATGLALFRVTQESLANVARHSPGAPALIDLDVDAARVRLVVTNPTAGRAPDLRGPAGPTGSGLNGMRERIGQLGGRVAAGPDGAGWRVEAALPLAVPAPSDSSCPLLPERR